MRRLRLALAVAAVGLAAAALSASGNLGPMLEPVRFGVAWLARPFTAAGQGVAKSAAASFPWKLAGENARLRSEVAAVSAETSRLETRLQEVRAVEELRAHLPDAPLRTVLARVVLIGPDPAVRELTLDRGSKDGVTVGAAVLGPSGFVIGRVRSTGERASRVRLASDPESRITVAVGEAPGVLVGDRGILAQLTNLRRDAPMVSGASVVTAGLDPGVPRGLPVGNVADVSTGPSDLFHVASVLLPEGSVAPVAVAIVLGEASG